MDRPDKWYFLRKWLFSKRYVVGLVLGFLLVTLAVSRVFGIDGSIIHYLLVLLSGTALILLALDCWTAYQNYTAALRGEPKEGVTAAESVLLQCLAESQDQLKSLQDEQRAQRDELMDYFTLWVHQIKTPIAASRLIIEELPESSEKQHLNQELFKIEQYTGLVLNYLRLESFHDDLHLQEENIGDLIRQIVRKYASFFIHRQISLNLGELDLTVITDKKWLTVVIEQILSNSVKYTKHGQISIYMQDGWLVISDTGIGIAKSDLDRVFERGFSGYNGRLTQQSSGLGLYLSKAIADQLGHDLQIQSVVGQGTSLFLDLSQEKLRQQ